MNALFEGFFDWEANIVGKEILKKSRGSRERQRDARVGAVAGSTALAVSQRHNGDDASC